MDKIKIPKNSNIKSVERSEVIYIEILNGKGEPDNPFIIRSYLIYKNNLIDITEQLN